MDIQFMRKLFVTILSVLLMLPFHSTRANEGGEIGIVIMAVGQVSAQTASGENRTLQRRSPIYEKDLLSTEAGARAQIRFTDGSLVSLQEKSSLKIDSYSYKSPEKKESAAYDLLKGSMRTISGVIGKTNHADYKVATPVATIGIRGTDYELALHDNPKSGSTELYGYINDGEINVKNEKGDSNYGFNQFFVVTAPDQPPSQLLVPPQFMFEGYVPDSSSQGGGDSDNDILLGRSTGLDKLTENGNVNILDVTNPLYMPFSTVKQLTGLAIYTFDTSNGNGNPLPTVTNGASASNASGTLFMDFTAQVITTADLTVFLTDGSWLTASTTANAISLVDVLANGQSILLDTGTCTGTSCAGAISPNPVIGAMNINLTGDVVQDIGGNNVAQNVVSTYQLHQTPTGVSITGVAVFDAVLGGW